jgi:hypothetical protein
LEELGLRCEGSQQEESACHGIVGLWRRIS